MLLQVCLKSHLRSSRPVSYEGAHIVLPVFIHSLVHGDPLFQWFEDIHGGFVEVSYTGHMFVEVIYPRDSLHAIKGLGALHSNKMNFGWTISLDNQRYVLSRCL